jgi:hypothetical protein
MNFRKLYSILILLCFAFSANAHTIDEIRLKFKLAIENAEVTETLSAQLLSIPNPDALTLAYIASLDALKAKHNWNPAVKIEFMDSFEKKISKAVNAMPNNIEIRFLRYSIQSNTPAFLGYSKNLKEDRKVMVSAFSNKEMLNNNKKLLSEIYQFLVDENSLSQSEKNIIENALRNN